MTDQIRTWTSNYNPLPNARLRLFCFPYAGGGASLYRSWGNILPKTIEVCPVQLPGRENRLHEQPITRMDALAERILEVFDPLLDLPFAFFGHSMGALIAFELTRRLRANGERLPVRLCVSGREAPQLPETGKPIHALPQKEFIAELRRLQGTPEAVLQHEELMELMLPLLRADFEMLETRIYREEPPLPTPISAFGGTDDPEVSREALEAWRELTSGSFTSRILPGGHFFIQEHTGDILHDLLHDLQPAMQNVGTL